MRAAAALCALLAAALPHAASAAPVLGLTVNATGGFAIGLNGQQWLTGGEVVVAGKRASAGEIVPVGAPQKRTGANELGQYEATTLSWVLPGSSEVLIETSFLTYASDPGVIAFEQSFPSGTTRTGAAWGTQLLPPRQRPGVRRLQRRAAATAPTQGGTATTATSDREALTATLPCGIVGPMDGINLLNASRVTTTCRGDGAVLRPDRPVMAADWCFASGRPTKYVYHTFSDVQGLGRVHYHFNNDKEPGLTRPMSLSRIRGHNYAVVIPTIPGANGAPLAFVGEVGKYVTHAAKPLGCERRGKCHHRQGVRGHGGDRPSSLPPGARHRRARCRGSLFNATGVQAVTMQL